MYVKFRFPTNVNGLGQVAAGQILALSGSEAVPLIARGLATPTTFSASPTPDPELDELKGKARRLGQNVDWAEQDRFKRKPHAVVVATEFQAEESFGEKLKRAIERLPCKQQKQREKKEYSRPRSPPPPRKPARGP